MSTLTYALICILAIGLVLNASRIVSTRRLGSSYADFINGQHHRSRNLLDITPNVNPNQEVDHLNRRATMSDLDLEAAKQHALKFVDLVYNRYQLGTWDVGVFFYMTTNIADVSFEIYKLRFAKKIMEKDSRYLMTYGGSSVTAGHDGQFNSSFSMIADKRLRPILDNLNIDLVTENIAQSANNCVPYHWCYEGMADEDPDFVNWEQSYNCGHDPDSFEITARVAGNSKNKGVVWYSASGAFSPIYLPESEFSPPYCEEEWTVESVQAPHEPLTHWYPDAAAVKAEREKLVAFNLNASSSKNFIKPNYYSSVAPSGFNVWTTMRPCPFNLTDVNGQHTKASDACAAADFANTRPEKRARFFSKEGGRYDNPSGRGAGHHPTKSFHMWRGEAIAYIHALAILDAIYMIEEDMKVSGNTREKLAVKYAADLEKMQTPMPAGGCTRYYCPHRAECFTDFKPHPRADHYLNSLFVGKMTWEQHDDWKTTYSNANTKDPLYLKVTVKPETTGIVLLCGASKESLKHTTISFDMHGGESTTVDYSKYSFETRPAGAAPVEVWQHRRYPGWECTELSQVPVGTHIIQIARNETIKSKHVNSLINVIAFTQ